MSRLYRFLLLALASGAVMLFADLTWAQTKGQTQNPPQKKAVEQKQEQTDQPYTEEEYNAYEVAEKEQDPAKKAALVFAFLEKYPKSTLKVNVVSIGETLMFNLNKAGEHKVLEPIAENWLKFNPNDVKAEAYIFDAAVAAGNHQKTVEYGEKLFAVSPNVKVAQLIFQAYDKLGNKAKRDEWALKLLQFPEFTNDIRIRYQFVVENAEKDLPKAADYAEQILKVLPNATKPPSMSESEWEKGKIETKKACYDIVGMNYYGHKNYNEAIQNLQKALDIEDYDSGYYYIGQSQWNLGDIFNAIDSFIRAMLLHGKTEAQAKAKSEQLYKSQQNDSLIGYDRSVRKNQQYLDARKVARAGGLPLPTSKK
jgi:tetratricopeptide (TPR) repeat protein